MSANHISLNHDHSWRLIANGLGLRFKYHKRGVHYLQHVIIRSRTVNVLKYALYAEFIKRVITEFLPSQCDS